MIHNFNRINNRIINEKRAQLKKQAAQMQAKQVEAKKDQLVQSGINEKRAYLIALGLIK